MLLPSIQLQIHAIGSRMVRKLEGVENADAVIAISMRSADDRIAYLAYRRLEYMDL